MSHVEIIAEAGVNHNGSLEMALRLVEVAAAAGADFVKFQTFTAADLVTVGAQKAPYQKVDSDPAETQFDLLRKLQLSAGDHRRIIDHCRAHDIAFLSSPFTVSDVKLLTEELGIETLKLPSGAITDGPVLLAAARTRARLILSTGMSTLDEIKAALSVIAFGLAGGVRSPSPADLEAAFEVEDGQRAVREQVTLLQCTTAYPTPIDEANLLAMTVLADRFGVSVGYSDHTAGTVSAVAAAGLGASVIEKHFTTDRSLPGPDHAASVEPGELRRLVADVRTVTLALGRPVKEPTQTEISNMGAARKSLVARTDIMQGEPFSTENLTTKRPGTGISPMHYWAYLGRHAGRDYSADELIDE